MHVTWKLFSLIKAFCAPAQSKLEWKINLNCCHSSNEMNWMKKWKLLMRHRREWFAAVWCIQRTMHGLAHTFNLMHSIEYALYSRRNRQSKQKCQIVRCDATRKYIPFTSKDNGDDKMKLCDVDTATQTERCNSMNSFNFFVSTNALLQRINTDRINSPDIYDVNVEAVQHTNACGN